MATKLTFQICDLVVDDKNEAPIFDIKVKGYAMLVHAYPVIERSKLDPSQSRMLTRLVFETQPDGYDATVRVALMPFGAVLQDGGDWARGAVIVAPNGSPIGVYTWRGPIPADPA